MRGSSKALLDVGTECLELVIEKKLQREKGVEKPDARSALLGLFQQFRLLAFKINDSLVEVSIRNNTDLRI